MCLSKYLLRWVYYLEEERLNDVFNATLNCDLEMRKLWFIVLIVAFLVDFLSAVSNYYCIQCRFSIVELCFIFIVLLTQIIEYSVNSVIHR